MRRFRVYADTSVIGGCMDQEFAADSLRFVEAVRRGELVLLLSDVVLRELEVAPQEVLSVLRSIPPEAVERVELTREVLELRDAYLAEGILHPKWTDDAAHVAAATVARADAIVSWNFRHIVRKRSHPPRGVLTPGGVMRGWGSLQAGRLGTLCGCGGLDP